MENEKKEQLDIARHSMAHVLAKALTKLYPQVKLTIGPSIEDGFYYDIDLDKNLTPEDFAPIEKQMKEILNKGEEFVRKEITKEEALKIFANNPYKIEIINELPEDEIISVYYLGEDFVDLCRGPHVASAKNLQNFGYKIHSVNGAYWRANENNKMLQRVYCYAFADKKQLQDHINMIEEAKKRDHRKIGRELELFFFDETAPGMPYWLPKGFLLYNILMEQWRKEHKKRGYQEFSGPILNKSDLWKISGHWDHYKDDMFVLTDSEEWEQALKPMNCPNSIKVFASQTRSYKDLPLRFASLDVLHRYEKSGQLNGLFRVRTFRQDDSHNFITYEQIGSEIREIVEIADKIYTSFGLPYELTLSTRPDDFMGDIETWNKAEQDLKAVLNDICGDNNYKINEGDGAFYGPKIDIKMKDCLGRSWQLGTIQLDFQLPQRFNISYIDKDNEKKTPVMVHRAILGSFERFIGIITEHFAGAFPLWLSPVQVKVLAITEKTNDYAVSIAEKLESEGIRVEADLRNEKIGYKIREATSQKIPYLIVVGEDEEQNGKISIRGRRFENKTNLDLEDFIARLKREIDSFALIGEGVQEN